MGELQKFTNVIVLDSIVTKVEFIHRNDVFGVIVLYVFITVSLEPFRCSLFKYFVMLEALKNVADTAKGISDNAFYSIISTSIVVGFSVYL